MTEQDSTESHDSEIFNVPDKSLHDLLSVLEKFTFLVGAGISMNAPSSIPSAREIVRELLGLCAPASEIDKLLSLESLRYELVVEKVKNSVDKDLHFLDYLDMITEPNAIHHFLAQAILKGRSYVVTTNFDHMIELAMERQLGDDEKDAILPVITKTDFTRLARPRELIKEGKYPVYKIHGDKHNAITGEDTTSSLVTTISSLGKQRVSSETFALESYKKQAMYNVMKNRTIVVMGYSGSDDFDIGPTLRAMPYVKNVVWIDHASIEMPEILVLNKKNSAAGNIDSLPRVQKVLVEIGKIIAGDVILVRGNTGKIADEELRKTILPDINAPEIVAAPEQPAPRFKDWIKAEFSATMLDDLHRLKVACDIYRDLNEFRAIGPLAEPGFTTAIENNDLNSIMYFANQIGFIFLALNECNLAIATYENCVQIAQDPISRAMSLANLALANVKKHYIDPGVDLEKAEAMTVDALHLFESRRDLWGKITCLNLLGEIYFLRGEFSACLDKFMEAFQFVVQAGNLEHKAALMNNMGITFCNLGNAVDGTKGLNEALMIKRELGDKSGIARTLFNLASVEYKGDPTVTEALERRIDEAQALFAAMDGKKDQAKMLVAMAFLRGQADRDAEATRCIEQATALVPEEDIEKVPPGVRAAIEAGAAPPNLDVVPLYIDTITREDTDVIMTGSYPWMPSHDSMALFGNAIELMQKGLGASGAGNDELAIESLEQALDIFKRLYRDDMVQSITSTLTGLKLKTGQLTLEEFMALRTTEANELKENIEKSIDEGTLEGMKDKILRIAGILDEIGSSELAERMRANASKYPDASMVEETSPGAGEKTDAVVAAEKVLGTAQNEDAMLEPLEHEQDDEFTQTIFTLVTASMFMEKKMDMNGMIECQIALGNLLWSRKEQKAATAHFENAINRAIIIGNEALQAKAEAAFAEIPLALGQESEALDHLEFALRVFDEKQMNREKIVVLDRVGAIWMNWNDLEIAKERFEESVQTCRADDTDNLKFKADALARLGDVNLRSGEPIEASTYFLDALELFEQIGSPPIMKAVTLQNLGTLDEFYGDYEMALEDLEESAALYQEAGDVLNIGNVEKKIAEFKERLANPDNELVDKQKLAAWMFKAEDYDKSRAVASVILPRLLDAGRVKEAIGLLAIDGDAAWKMEEREDAKHSYEQAIELARETGDERLDKITEALARLEIEMATPAVKAGTLIKEARRLLGKGMTDEALHDTLEAVEVYMDVGQEDLIASAYHLAATICYEMKNFADAEHYANEAIEIFEFMKLDALLAESLFLLGNSQKDQEKTDDAFVAYQRAFDIFSRNGNTHAMASCEHMIGTLLLGKNNRLAALPHLTNAADLYKKNNEARYAESMYLRAGTTLEQLNRFPEALDQFEKALAIIEQLDPTNDMEIATCEERIGHVLCLQHKLDAAMEKLQHARQVFEGNGNQRMNAAVLKTIGDVLSDKGDVAGATETYYAAIALYETLDDIGNKAVVINRLAIMNEERCHFDDALKYYEEAAAIAKESTDMSGHAAYMFNTAVIHVIKGDLDAAEWIIKESLAFAEKNSTVEYLAPFHATYGDLQRDRTAFEEATKHYEASRKYYEELGDPDGIALALCEIARISAQYGHIDEATDLLHQGMERARESGKQATMAALLSAEGEITAKRGDLAAALSFLEQARAIYETDGKILGEADCFEKMANIHAQLGEIDASTEQMRKARELFQAMGLTNRISRMRSIQQSVPETLKSEIDELFEPGKAITFLVGAGISMNPPSSLPSARLLCKTLFDFLGPLKNFEDLYAIKELRYEMIMERIKEYVDPGLDFLDYLALVDIPNRVHLFLAACIICGMNVITTNFDFLIERSLKFLLPTDKYTDVLPVITEGDFLAVQDEIGSETATTGGNKKYFLFKIHGCKRNDFTDEDTSESIITTISALGKNKDKEKTFGLEPFKEITVSKLLSRHVLVVMGYSGSDDFDMTPVLASTDDLESLIWIEHVQEGDTSIIHFDATTPPEINPFLYKLRQAHGYDIFLVKTRTDEFVRDYLVPRFVPDLASRIQEIYDRQVMIRQDMPIFSFEEFLEHNFKIPDAALCLKFATSIYFDAGQFDRALQSGKTGLHIVNEEFTSGKLIGDRKEQYEHLRHWFLNQLALNDIKRGDPDDAANGLQYAIKNAKDEGNLEEEAESSNNLAVALMDLDKMDYAAQYLDAALQIDLQLQDEKHLGHVLANMGKLRLLNGDLQGALQSFDESIDHASKAGDLEEKCFSMAKLGAVHAEMGDDAQALPILEEATAIARSLGSLPLQLECFTPLLGLYKRGAVPQEDVEALSRKVDALNESLGVQKIEARRQYTMADSLFKAKNYDLGLKHLVMALETAEKAGEKEYMVKACKGLAYYYRNLLKWEDARVYFEKLIEIARKIGYKSDEREALYNVGFVLENLKAKDEAFSMYESVLAMAKEENDDTMMAKCYDSMASIHYSQGLDDSAIFLQKQVVEIYDTLQKQAEAIYGKMSTPLDLVSAKSKLDFYINNPSSRWAKDNDIPEQKIETPAGTALPQESEAPAGTALPQESEEPAGTALPQESEAPAGTALPQESEEPAGTALPQESERPAGTALPLESKTPAYQVSGKIEFKASTRSMQPAPPVSMQPAPPVSMRPAPPVSMQPAPLVMKKFCMYCGVAYVPGPAVKFCKKCGRKLPST